MGSATTVVNGGSPAGEAVACSSCGGEQPQVGGSARRRAKRLKRIGWRQRGALVLCPECQRQARELSESLETATH